MKKTISKFLIAVISLCCINIYAQELGKGTSSVENDLDASEFTGTVQMAMSNNDYMVTAGDIYSLTYAANGIPVNYTIPVDPTYKIRVSNLAVLDASGKSYITLKKQVEEIVQKNYPMSGVQFVLMNPASFKVVINGEVKKTTERRAWALTRLSSVVSGTTTPYSSLRDITVTSANGKKRTYDIFKATRDGDLSQNPYVRPGDVITLNRIKRVVTISGAIERPGEYELMKGENLKDLIEYYGHGLAELADTSRIELVRSRDNMEVGGEKIYLTQKEIDANYVLLNRDTINIKSKASLLPYITIEGIINMTENGAAEDIADKDMSTVNMIRHRTVKFYDGENYATLVRRYKGIFNSYSDLENAYVERNGNKIAMNLETIIEDELYVSDYQVERGDKLVIPFIQHFMTVLINGEVNSVREEGAWPLRRLSAILEGNMTAYSSTRDIIVTSVDGIESHYDLFKASRDGDLSHNPFIRAGETITVQRMERKVTISGSVERPGTYELKSGEGLKDLVSYYGHGLAELADTSRIELVRSRDNMEVGGEKIYLTQKEIDDNYELLNRDTITIANKSSLLPYITIEGIINMSENKAAEEMTEKDMDERNSTIDMIRHRTVKFYDGENYATLVRRYKDIFNSYSDLENAYVERNGNKIAMNLETIIEDELYVSDYQVERGDKLVIPFIQHFMTVLVNGEVNAVRMRAAWPLRRLSEYLEDSKTAYSSTRDIIVTSVDGIESHYDLFKASRDGDLSHNPFIRAGETITVQRMERKVTISGSVERPGTYEIKNGDNLKSLIEYYGHGLTNMADTSRIELTRLLNETGDSAQKIYLNQQNIDDDFNLACYDTVYINSYATLKPVMFFEGAINASEGTSLDTAERIAVQFDNNTNYAYLIRDHAAWFKSSSCDGQNAYIIRGNKIIPINIDQILYDKSYYSDLTVEPYDTVRVPFKQYFVSVAGAVHNPGRYPYIPDRTYEYYIGLAGGFISEKNAFDAVGIVDINGKKLKKSDVITPETTITAESNSALYKFNQYSGVVTTTLTILSTTLSTLAIILQFKNNSK